MAGKTTGTINLVVPRTPTSTTSPATEMEDPAPFWKKQGKKGHFFQKNLPNNGKKIMEKIFQIMEKKMEQTMEGTAL